MSVIDINVLRYSTEIFQTQRSSYSVQLKMYDLLIPILAAVIIIINFMVVLSSGLILHKRQQPRSTYIFLGNVALADMLTAVAIIFGQYYPSEWRSELICCCSIGMIISATLVSVYSVGLIAVDRFLYIMFGLQYQRFLSSKRARWMVLGTWFLGCFVGFLPAMGVRNPIENGLLCWMILLEPTGLVLATVTIGILPLITIIVLYSIILNTALGKISEIRRSKDASRQTENSVITELRFFRGGLRNDSSPSIFYIEEEPRKELNGNSFINCCCKTVTLKITEIQSPSRCKAIKVVVLTTGCFFITWFPYFFACTMYVFCDEEKSPHYCSNLRIAIASPLAILGLLNSLFNPIIYAWWHNGFRKSAKKIMNAIWSRCIKPKKGSHRRNFTQHAQSTSRLPDNN